jgi:hypothetical protein
MYLSWVSEAMPSGSASAVGCGASKVAAPAAAEHSSCSADLALEPSARVPPTPALSASELAHARWQIGHDSVDIDEQVLQAH